MPVIKLRQRHESELRCQYVSLKYEPVLLSGSLPESGKLLQVLADKITDGLDSRCALVGSPAAPWEPTNRIKAVSDYLIFDFLEFRAPKSAIGAIVIEARGLPVTTGSRILWAFPEERDSQASPDAAVCRTLWRAFETDEPHFR